MKSLSLRMKLMLMSLFQIAVAVVIGGIGYWSSHRISSEFRKISDVSMPNASNLNQAMLQFRGARSELLTLALPETTTEQAKASLQSIDSFWVKYDQAIKEYKEVPSYPGEDEIYKKFETSINTVRDDFKKSIELYNKNSDYNSADRKAMRHIAGVEVYKHAGDARDAFRALMDFHKARAQEAEDSADKASSNGAFMVSAILFAGVLAGFLFSFFFSGSLAKTLSAIGSNLSDSGTQVNSAASEIANSSQTLSQASAEQAASLEQTAASIEEMSSMVNKNSENARLAAERSEQSKTQAARGQDVVRKMIESMGDIKTSNQAIMVQVNESNARITEIVKVINEIGTKTKVINDIVFQTKLLSFNASVEAARAGEHGKGFAVVAEEVGNLAQMSGKAAKEISDMLGESIKKVESIVEETKSKVESMIAEGSSIVSSGEQVARDCGEVLQSIVTNVDSVAQMAQEIASASREQSQGVAEITKAMGQLDQVTQQNAATSEEAASASEELAAQAQSLKGIVGSLVATIHGQGSSAVRFEAPAARVSNVVPMKKTAVKAKTHIAKSEAKTAAPVPAASNDDVPSYGDARFKDV